MTELDYIKTVARDYEAAGYSVVLQPDRTDLPTVLVDTGVDLLARRGSETVAVQVKRRDELYDLLEVGRLAEQVEKSDGWRLDVVVMPAAAGDDELPEGLESDPRRIQALVAEAEVGLNVGAVRSAFLVAWAASEAAMREAARRGGLTIDRETPSLVLANLYTNGLVSREEYDRGRRYSRVRNALAHGYDPPAVGANDVRFLMDLSQRLLSPEAIGTSP